MLKKYLHIIFLFWLVVPCTAQDKTPSIYQVTQIPVNNGAFSEISPVIYNDGIIFCSDRRFSAVTDRKTFEGRRLYNLYYAEKKDSTIWLKPEEITSERSKLFNNGPMCLSPDGKTVYFTSDVETGKITRKRNFINHSGIFTAELSGTNLLSITSFPYNNQLYDIGQPSISPDGRYLFFASNMPGGQGGADLYYCEWINGKWSTPSNLGPGVNSQGAENFPFIHASGRLYFSSNRTGGKGKMDVYYTMMSLGSWEDPIAMPEPINSPDDDFAFVADAGMQTGYFSSNRGKNDDIYEFSSLIIRKASCDTLVENNYCYQLEEVNAIRYDTIPFRYEWNFGDGSPGGVGTSVIHCYASPGTYVWHLDVVNLITKEVMYNEKTDTLIVLEVEQPYISGPDTGNAGQNLKFDANSTNLPGWNIAQYYWNFDDESIGIGKEVDKTYLRPGAYNIQLIVTAEPEPGGVTRETCVCKNIIIARQP
jgi:hypothetical protein